MSWYRLQIGRSGNSLFYAKKINEKRKIALAGEELHHHPGNNRRRRRLPMWNSYSAFYRVIAFLLLLQYLSDIGMYWTTGDWCPEKIRWWKRLCRYRWNFSVELPCRDEHQWLSVVPSFVQKRCSRWSGNFLRKSGARTLDECYLVYYHLCGSVSCIQCVYERKLLVPFITALLFAAHPLHTEVVANIKSRDEIMSCSLFIDGSGVYRYATLNKVSYLIAAGLHFSLLFFPKNLLLPGLRSFRSSCTSSVNQKTKYYVRSSVVLVFWPQCFWLSGRKILGNVDLPIPVVDNSLVAIDNILVQRANAISILGYYLKLFVLPWLSVQMVHSMHISALSLFDWKVLVPFILFLPWRFSLCCVSERKICSV